MPPGSDKPFILIPHKTAVTGDLSAESGGELASVVFISHDSLPKLKASKLFGMTDWEWRGEQGVQLKTMQTRFNFNPA